MLMVSCFYTKCFRFATFGKVENISLLENICSILSTTIRTKYKDRSNILKKF